MAIQPWLNQYLKEKQMSNTNLRQKWYSKNSVKIVYTDNKELSQAVLELLKNHYKSNANIINVDETKALALKQHLSPRKRFTYL